MLPGICVYLVIVGAWWFVCVGLLDSLVVIFDLVGWLIWW